ncbi:MAG: hypothetical protein WBO45_19630 [Planctomycetota bacterium]
MPFVVECLLALGLPQLAVEPFPGVVGQPMAVTVREGARPGIAIEVELPDGAVQACGVTATDGRVVFTPAAVGRHVFVANIAGVRTLAPVAVIAARTRWPLALASVPLGLALLWWQLGARRRAALPHSPR